MRRAATKAQRLAAWLATDGKCAICGRSLPDNFHVDHVIPFSKGGETEAWNLRPRPVVLERADHAPNPLVLLSVFIGGHGGRRNAERLTARIKRDHEDVYARMVAGEFDSVRAAAREAGIVKDPDPVKLVVRTIGRMNAQQIERLRIELRRLEVLA